MTKVTVLTQDAFDKLLAWLDADRDAAGQKYESIRHTLTRFFEWRRCRPADEFADETINRVACRIAGGELVRSLDPRRYFYGVARHVCQESLKVRAFLGVSSERSVVCDSSRQLECVQDCLADLPAASRELLESYYLDERGSLADRLGVTPNALRIRVFKEKQKLRACIERCLGQDAGRRNDRKSQLRARA